MATGHFYHAQIKFFMPLSSESGRLKSALRLVAELQRLIEVRLEIGCPYIIDRA